MTEEQILELIKTEYRKAVQRFREEELSGNLMKEEFAKGWGFGLVRLELQIRKNDD